MGTCRYTSARNAALLIFLLSGCHGMAEAGFEMDTAPVRAHSGSLAVRGGVGELREPGGLLATDAALRLQTTADELDVSVGLGLLGGYRGGWDWDIGLLLRPTFWAGSRGVSLSVDLGTLLYLGSSDNSSNMIFIAPRFEVGGEVGSMIGFLVGYGSARSFTIPH